MDMEYADRERHIRILGWLWIVRGLLLTLVAVITFISCFIGGIFSGTIIATFLTPLIGLVVGFFLFLFALTSFATGMGLLEGRGWARVFAMVLAVLAFCDFPLGTALCIYTFWTLWGRDSDDYFEGYRSHYEYNRY